MDKAKNEQFKALCKIYLMTVGRANLCAYGRSLHLTAPTKLNKADLIDRIIGVLCGEIIEKRKKVGAPVKNSNINENIPQEIEKIRLRIFGEETIQLQPSAEMLQTTETEQQIEENSEPFQLTIIIDKVTSEQKKLLRQLLKTL